MSTLTVKISLKNQPEVNFSQDINVIVEILPKALTIPETITIYAIINQRASL